MDTSSIQEHKCSECRSEVTSDLRGRRCPHCAIPKVLCCHSAWGCTNLDLPIKSKKHSSFFCSQSTLCRVCDEYLPRGTLSTHYTSLHVVFNADFSLRANETDEGEYCCVASPAGTAVLFYWTDNIEFIFRVYMPVLSERLCEYRCEVRVKQIDTEQEKTYTPDVTYDEEFDWCVVIDKRDFPAGIFVFDVFVNITRI